MAELATSEFDVLHSSKGVRVTQSHVEFSGNSYSVAAIKNVWLAQEGSLLGVVTTFGSILGVFGLFALIQGHLFGIAMIIVALVIVSKQVEGSKRFSVYIGLGGIPKTVCERRTRVNAENIVAAIKRAMAQRKT